MPSRSQRKRTPEEVEVEKNLAISAGAGPRMNARRAPTARGGLLRAKIVREYVRAYLVEPAVKRLFAVGMGHTKHDVMTAVGTVIEMPAPASVQVEALGKLIALGVPAQLGIVDGDDHALPGVFALPETEMDLARDLAHADQVAVVELDDQGQLPAERQVDDAALGAGAPTLEQQILARRRNGHGNGR